MREAERSTNDSPFPLRAALVMIGVGVLLGLVANQATAERKRLPLIAEDRAASLATLDAVAPHTAGETPAPGAASENPYRTDVDDPMAIAPGAVADAPELPEIPDLGRPMQVELAALKQLWDAGAVVVVDAREPHEFAAGHIPGAINLPFDEVVSDPSRLEALDAAGRPIVTYCGGGQCELSLSLAHELVAAGHGRVLVYMGGFPEWEQAGYAVERGAAS
jgi:rhodanese-related sulfurtransferase